MRLMNESNFIVSSYANVFSDVHGENSYQD